METKTKIRGILYQDNSILLCRLSKLNFYCLPGGTLNKGETNEECLSREMVEELGIVPKIGKLLYVHKFQQENRNTTDYWYHITNSEDFFEINLNKTTHGFELSEVRYIPIPQLHLFDIKPRNMYELLQKKILPLLKSN